MAFWGFTSIDMLAIGFFFCSWVGHFWIINSSPLRSRTITHHMNVMRVRWMRALMHRDPKMFDALIQNQFQQGVLFFASTSILIVGALLAGLGATDKAIDMLTDLPFSTTNSRTVWEVKVVLITCIFVFSFFKFAWSHRQFNYVTIIAGAVPPPEKLNKEQKETYAQKMAAVHALAAMHFTTGLNAYFFALAAFAWFLNAWAFIIATLWVTAVLYRRAFASRFMNIISEPEGWYDDEV